MNYIKFFINKFFNYIKLPINHIIFLLNKLECKIIIALLILFFFFINTILYADEYNPNCYFNIGDNELNQALKKKEDTFNEINFDKILTENLPPEEKPCTLSLYTMAKENHENIWYKFYCSIIADEKGYPEYAKSLRLKLHEDKKATTIEHILLAIEFAKFNKIYPMEKQLAQALYKISSCEIIPEYIWLNSDIYLINKLIDFSPTSFQEIKSSDITRFYKIVQSSLMLFPNFNGKSIIMILLSEILLRNSEYKLAKDFKSFSLFHSTSFGTNGIDLYELLIAQEMQKWIIFILLFAFPVFFLCICKSVINSYYNNAIIKRAFITIFIITIIIILTIKEINQSNSIISFLKNAPIDFKSGLKNSPQTINTINSLYNKNIPESIFLLALYYHIHKNYYDAYETYNTILSNEKTKTPLKAKSLNNLGALSYALNEVQEAKAYYQMALSLNKNYPPSLYNLYLINNDNKLLSKAKETEEMKINFLNTYSNKNPYIALLNYRELTKVFSRNKNNIEPILNALKFNKDDKYQLILKIELLIAIISLFICFLLSSIKQANAANIKNKTNKSSLANKILEISLPGYFFIEKGRIYLGAMFMFSFFIGIALIYKIIINNSFLLNLCDFSKVWYEFMKKNDFNTSSLLNPAIYSLSLYLTFLSVFLNSLIAILGIVMEKNN